MDLYSRKAKFENVKEDEKALEFHKSRYDNGSRDALAKLCWQTIELRKR